MPVNRSQLIRLTTIDRCLQNRYRRWTLDDLIEACSEAIYEYEGRTEGVSRRTVQADILTSEIEYYRTLLEPVIRKICTAHLRMLGCRGDVSVSWSNISLLDEVELARARLLNAQAREVEERLEVQD